MITINTDPASPDFNSYANVDDLTRFAASRGYDIPSDSDECGTLLFQALDYLNGLNWIGARAEKGQHLPWPRRHVLIDDEMLDPHTVPSQVIQAQCRLAVEAQDGALDASFTKGVTTETAGKVSVQFADDASGELYFPWLDGVLRGLLSVAINTFAMRV
ncbi:DnaT-like ssDNA-binding protein [Rahnella sp. ChDrAdgB13]|uniref:DnaT-like ssDNA-binding protein n=1 Tax=Rahnella sp. ChDrAdgB13 TaxID=1850581 RepID=UPI001AD86976|nr:DnaT-like ssDNA-binding protein [Rahnella sp. ChDrAdgB13]